MLFGLEWNVPIENRVAVWNTLGNMEEKDHKSTQGGVKLIHNYLKLVGDSGFKILEAESHEEVMKWLLHWSHLVDLKVYPVLEKSVATECIKQSPLVEIKGKSEAFKDELQESSGKMNFIVECTIPIENRVTVWNAVSNMSKEDGVKILGSVKVIGKYLTLTGDSGVVFAESDNFEDMMKWIMNWSHLADMKVYPVLGVSDAKNCMRQSDLFVKKA